MDSVGTWWGNPFTLPAHTLKLHSVVSDLVPLGNAAVLDRMQEIRTMQEALTQKHLAMDSDLLQKAAKGDMKQDGEFVSDLTDLMSEVSTHA